MKKSKTPTRLALRKLTVARLDSATGGFQTRSYLYCSTTCNSCEPEGCWGPFLPGSWVPEDCYMPGTM